MLRSLALLGGTSLRRPGREARGWCCPQSAGSESSLAVAGRPRGHACVAAGSSTGSELNAKQRKEMRAHAQRLGKKLLTVQVGKAGLTSGVTSSVDEILEAHEICKVKIYDGAEETADAAGALSSSLGATVCAELGGTVLLVRVRRSGEPSVLRPILAAALA
jgi:RNA-binding protein